MFLKINNEIYCIDGDDANVKVAISVIKFIEKIHFEIFKNSTIEKMESYRIVKILSNILKERGVEVSIRYLGGGDGNILEYNYV